MAEQSSNSRQNNETHLITEEGFEEGAEQIESALDGQQDQISEANRIRRSTG